MKYLFTLKFWKFYYLATKKSFIRYPLLRGLKFLITYINVYNCLISINNAYKINLDINNFNNFAILHQICLEWKNGQINPYLEIIIGGLR